MNMNVIKSEKRLCACCMEEHEVKTVVVKENASFKNVNVEYDAEYFCCSNEEVLYADETQMRKNYARVKDAYRVSVG